MADLSHAVTRLVTQGLRASSVTDRISACAVWTAGLIDFPPSKLPESEPRMERGRAPIDAGKGLER